MRFPLQPSLGTVLAILTCLQAFGVYIYLKGFLLTRQTLNIRGHSRTSWDRFPLSSASSPTVLPSIPSGYAFNRTIIIVIDALRFDFSVHSSHTDHYLNKLPVIQRLLDTQPQSSLLFQFRADPPTTTMQRIKGLMTGSLPTFIDVGSNFASSEVQEDHLLHHVKQRYNNIYFMGDDTWVHLYPDVFDQPDRTFDSDSFKMLDLDSVDDSILSHLWPLMDSDNWELAIAHFLGVDHCGHTYGPSHPNMARKLDQMNTVIERILGQVDNNTLFILMGDHGMSPEGDHGGESLEELMSTLFIHSGRPLGLGSHPEPQENTYPVVAQVNLVPTLSYLLQVPIPFGNLGAIIPDLLLPDKPSDNKIYNLLHIVGQFRINALQVYDYIIHYSQQTKQPDFSTTQLGPILKHLYDADNIMFELALFEYDAFLIGTIQYCESIWAQFDAGSMLLGIALLGLSVIVSMLSMNIEITRNRLLYSTLFMVPVLFALQPFTITLWQHGWFEKMSYTDWLGVLFSFYVCCLFSSVTCLKTNPLSLDWGLTFIISLAQSFTLGSNSYVVWEDASVRYVLSALSILWFTRNCLSTRHDPNLAMVVQAAKEPLLFLTVVRLTSATGQCREEQFPYCQYLHHDFLSYDSYSATLVSISFIVTVILVLFYSSLLLKRSVGKDRIPHSVYQLCGMIVAIRMIVEIHQSSTETATGWMMVPVVVRKILDVYLPRLVYALCVFISAYVVHQRSCYSKPQQGWVLLFIWSTMLAMLQRPLASLIILLSPWVVRLLFNGDQTSLLLRLTLLQFFGHHLFFVTGHQATFTSLPWKAAFVGFDDMNYYGGMVLVTLSTLAGYIISWIGWLVLLSKEASKRDIKQSLFLLILMQAVPTFLCAIFVFILRRHLMTWKIFAPRFLFQILLDIGAHLATNVLERMSA
ncbi:alkaline phosphatase-like protein [Rhizopus microsporus ATCC 52813]|uniref:Alkaline phosphatase-like protein n=1 Tax=Rhizopus microsporus ATCC 52813 TaxID=1340429 RepID=A0A2G4T6T9_RHIZD|nr:alkaline phosphatase-like protein [Rhizopus microsporus ATCC 52813]PHZ16733.1 alkaline phosphatase-like protein [Rhizopus microsporus ATCC 52813]